MKIRRLYSFVITALALAAVAVCSSHAASIGLNIDSTRSTITLGGTAFGLAFNPQVAGANQDKFGGTITADLTGGVLTFSGGSSITALLNPLGPFSTAPAPYPTGGDDYGMTGTGFVTGYGVVTFMGAYRSLTFDITAGTATQGAAPSGMTLALTSGQLDWGASTGLGPTGGTSSLIGVSGTNTASSVVTFDGTTLTLPVQLHTTGANRAEDWTGTITAVVPEPGSLGLGMLAALAAMARRRMSRV